MATLGHLLFDTPIGRCGIAWGERGVTGVRLPPAAPWPGVPAGDPPDFARAAVAAIRALLRGEPADLRDVVLDLDEVPEFHRRVYAVAREIPPGATSTYGAVAERLGERGASRAVGQALGCNPFPIVVPCHRVLAAGHRSGGFSAPGGTTTKHRLLALEGAELPV